MSRGRRNESRYHIDLPAQSWSNYLLPPGKKKLRADGNTKGVLRYGG